MYEVDYWNDDVAAAIAALPEDLLIEFAEFRAALELSPWAVGTQRSLTAPGTPVAGPFGYTRPRVRATFH